MATLLQVTEILTTAAAAYPNFRMQVGVEAFSAAWERHVGKLDAGLLQRAMDRAVAGSEFFPTVHDVLKAAGEIAAGEPRTGLEAWHDLGVAVQAHGYNDPPGVNWQFDDPITTEAAIALGWRAYCASDEDSLRWAFAKIYDALRVRKVSVEMNAPKLPAGDTRKVLDRLKDKLTA